MNYDSMTLSNDTANVSIWSSIEMVHLCFFRWFSISFNSPHNDGYSAKDVQINGKKWHI